MKSHFLVICTSGLCLSWIWMPMGLAQMPTLVLPETLKPRRLELTPLPETLPAPTSTPELTAPQPLPSPPDSILGAKVKVKRVEVLGSTVFSTEELNKVVAPFVGRDLSFEQLLEIRTAITNLYISQGYTTSGAFLPSQVPQDTASGVIKIQVVEGDLEKLEIIGLKHLKEGYVRSRIALAAGTPLNIRRLEEALQLLQLDPLFSRVQAELKAGIAPGRSVLTLNLTETPAIHAAYLVENRDSPSVGSIRNSAIFNHENLLGLGDRLHAEAGFTEGLKSYDFSYDIPVN
ncbi:MAG: ShlB/FhaC/HecB family hemolysin secretion/activation protein, partial [Aphanothece sp. CMT-3BRIN-NPC111]|nr:ShlB/FhaC/HecB family hemolysin secretion/activation protein [Aphanothece sp. CMT-3BRIN-NPC111]